MTTPRQTETPPQGPDERREPRTGRRSPGDHEPAGRDAQEPDGGTAKPADDDATEDPLTDPAAEPGKPI